MREVYEETGTTVVIQEFLGWYERTGFRPHRSPVYVCTPTGGSLRAQLDETITVRYFPLLALPRGLFPWYRPMLQGDLDSTAPRPLRRINTWDGGPWSIVYGSTLVAAVVFSTNTASMRGSRNRLSPSQEFSPSGQCS